MYENQGDSKEELPLSLCANLAPAVNVREVLVQSSILY
jgi:hypothetical protein